MLIKNGTTVKINETYAIGEEDKNLVGKEGVVIDSLSLNDGTIYRVLLHCNDFMLCFPESCIDQI